MDNLITGDEDNISAWRTHPGFTFLRHDVVQPLEHQAEAIFHLASPTGPLGLGRPLEPSLANSLGTYNLLDLARRAGARLLLASTSEAYGDPLEHPQREDYWGHCNPVGPRACYDEAKRYAESLTMVYVRQFGLDGRIARIFNCYGPHNRPDDGRVVPNFVTQALTGLPLTIYGTGKQTRSLCYVDDMVDGLMRLMFAERTQGEVVNIGNPEERTVLEFAETIKALCASPSPIVFLPATEDDPQRRRPDIAKARALLDWEPRVGLTEGLEKTIAWFHRKLAAEGKL